MQDHCVGWDKSLGKQTDDLLLLYDTTSDTTGKRYDDIPSTWYLYRNIDIDTDIDVDIDIDI